MRAIIAGLEKLHLMGYPHNIKTAEKLFLEEEGHEQCLILC